MNIVTLWKLSRPFNCFMAAIASIIGFFLSSPFFTLDFRILFSFLTVAFVCAGGQAINDYFDFKVDKKKGQLKYKEKDRKIVLTFSISMMVIGIAISSFLPIDSLIIAIAFSLLLIIYSSVLKKYKFIGNYVVALGTAFALIFGASITGNYLLTIIFALSAFFANSFRELAKDLEDLEVDIGEKVTLPMLIGDKFTKIIAILFAFIAIAITIVPFANNLTGWDYLLVAFFSWIALGFSIGAINNNDFRLAQQSSKYAMLIALVAYILAFPFIVIF